MAEQREDPWAAFNYRVSITPKQGPNVLGGFSEISGLNTEITYAEYREGTDAENHVRKVPTISKMGDVTLKRGLIGSLGIFEWVDQVRRGDQNAEATVVIELFSEDHSTAVATWTLSGARPSKWTGPSLSAKSTDVAMEELVLVCEKIVYS
ncbi:MAG: phage tail protein [Myxococcales bacterium]|nr:phage tail protein [Myxococcales bacterium]